MLSRNLPVGNAHPEIRIIANFAKVALFLAFVGIVDGFHVAPLRTLAPALRTKNEKSALPSLGLRERAKSSQFVLGLRATATSPFTEALEKAYAEPAVPHCRERMYKLAQVRSIVLRCFTKKNAFSDILHYYRRISMRGMRPSKLGITTRLHPSTLRRTLRSSRQFRQTSSATLTQLAATLWTL